MTTSPPPPRRKVNAAVLLITAAVFVTVPLLVFLALFLWLTQPSFVSVDEIKVEELEDVRIELKNLPRGVQNRPSPKKGEANDDSENTPDKTDPDIPKTNLIRPDFDALLGTLRDAQPVEAKDWPAGAYLGKIEIRYKDGRGGTIMLRWALDKPGVPSSPAWVWMQIGPQRFKACRLKELREVAEMCAARGRLP